MYQNNEIAKHYVMLKSLADEAEASGDLERAEELEERVADYAKRLENHIFTPSSLESDLDIHKIFENI